MDTGADAVQNKLKLLFEKFREPGYVLDTYYGDSLINKLASTNDPETVFLESSSLLSHLLIDGINAMESADITVKVFIIRLFSIVSHYELHFERIYCQDTDKTIGNAFKEINGTEMKPSLKVAYLEMAIAALHHGMGVKWLLDSGVWRNILNLCSTNQTVFVVRKTYKFTSKFLWKLNDIGDETNLREVLKVVLNPLLQKDYINIQIISSEDELEHCEALEPMLHMLLALFEDASRIRHPTLLMTNLIHHYKITSLIYILNDRLRMKKIVLLISKLLFWFVVSKTLLIKPMVDGVEYSNTDFHEIKAAYYNNITNFITRRCPTLVLDYCNYCNITWAQIWQGKESPCFENSLGQKLLIQRQLVFIQIVPILVYVFKKGCSGSDSADLRLQEFVMKLLNYSCEHTARSCYAMRDLMLELDAQAITLQSVKRLSSLINRLHNDQANMIFQALFYVLRDYDPATDYDELKPGEENYEETQEKVQVMMYVMDMVLLLVKNYEISWKDSIEIISLYTTVYSILKMKRNLTCKFVITSLNVIAVTVKKCLPPNLSLLLETKPGSSVHGLGELIYMKMHDMNWEVRDSALELLLVVTEISFMKFPSFQTQITEKGLMRLAATMALNDHEFYVQASALKCLAASTKVNSIWEHLRQDIPDIMDKLVSIVRGNQEGLVRKEAVNVLCEMYQNTKMAAAVKQTLYEHMVSTAVTDFYWEAQIAALKFWRVVIQAHLTEQGMLDGIFPNVTFSKESRKIVTLNDKEIQKRLLRALDELSTIGCLTVLVKLLQDDVEVEIIDTALTVATELLDIINKYKVTDILPPPQKDQEVLLDILSHIREDTSGPSEADTEEIPNRTDEVIEGILNSNDINLLSNIYEEQMKLQSEKCEVTVVPKIKLHENVTPTMFVNYCSSKDFKVTIEQKRQWNDGIRSLSSLLDDTLGIYDVTDEVNAMDCY